MKIKLPETVSGISHEGVEYTPDENGHVTVQAHQTRVVEFFQGLGFEITPEDADNESPAATEGDGLETDSTDGTEPPGEPDSGGNGTPTGKKKRGTA